MPYYYYLLHLLLTHIGHEEEKSSSEEFLYDKNKDDVVECLLLADTSKFIEVYDQ